MYIDIDVYIYFHLQQEAAERQSRLEQEQKVLAEALTAAEKKMVDEKGR